MTVSTVRAVCFRSDEAAVISVVMGLDDADLRQRPVRERTVSDADYEPAGVEESLSLVMVAGEGVWAGVEETAGPGEGPGGGRGGVRDDT